jgi:ParB family transcriptional regulator, chromosome partitioning protein
VASPKRGMGRGLDAILSVSAAGGAEHGELREVPVDSISPNPRQPRRRFEEEALNALAGSLGERGVLQPVLVRPKPDGTYELIAGERRWRAATIAGLKTIPALVRPHDDAEALETALIENVAREDLNPVEEAQACAALVEELGLTREQVARRIGKGRVALSNLMRLLELPDEVLKLLEEGSLSEGHGRALLTAKDHGERRRLARDAVAGEWTVRLLEERARRSNDEAKGDVAGRSSRAGARRARGVHPDQAAAAVEIEAALGAALGAEVKARARADGGYRVELVFESREEALELAARVGGGGI